MSFLILILNIQESGRTIVGQCNISHPVQSQTSFSFSITPSSPVDEAVEGQSNFDNDDIMPQNLTFNKSNEGKEDPLESRISRKHYARGLHKRNLIKPIPVQDCIISMHTATKSIRIQTLTFYPNARRGVSSCIHAVRYGLGRFFLLFSNPKAALKVLSIIPCLALKGVASAIAGSKTLKAKVILRTSLNYLRR